MLVPETKKNHRVRNSSIVDHRNILLDSIQDRPYFTDASVYQHQTADRIPKSSNYPVLFVACRTIAWFACSRVRPDSTHSRMQGYEWLWTRASKIASLLDKKIDHSKRHILTMSSVQECHNLLTSRILKFSFTLITDFPALIFTISGIRALHSIK